MGESLGYEIVDPSRAPHQIETGVKLSDARAMTVSAALTNTPTCLTA